MVGPPILSPRQPIKQYDRADNRDEPAAEYVKANHFLLSCNDQRKAG
jgi:hypothetical protein